MLGASVDGTEGLEELEPYLSNRNKLLTPEGGVEVRGPRNPFVRLVEVRGFEPLTS